jgi:hypothetical protein
MDLKAYWAGIRQQQAALAAQFPEGFCHLCSVANRDRNTVAGNVTVVAVDNAARCLAEGTHRIATAEDIAGWQARQEDNRRLSSEVEFRTRGQFFVREPWSTGKR